MLVGLCSAVTPMKHGVSCSDEAAPRQHHCRILGCLKTVLGTIDGSPQALLQSAPLSPSPLLGKELVRRDVTLSFPPQKLSSSFPSKQGRWNLCFLSADPEASYVSRLLSVRMIKVLRLVVSDPSERTCSSRVVYQNLTCSSLPINFSPTIRASASGERLCDM